MIETMRLFRLSGSICKNMDEAIILEGKLIPKVWLIIDCLSFTHKLDPIAWKKDKSRMHVKTGGVA